MNNTQTSKTPILGIQKVSELTSKNGEAFEILNLRPEHDGTWRPIPNPKKLADLSGVFKGDARIIHSFVAAGDDAYLVAQAQGNRLLLIIGEEKVASILIGKIVSISTLGNVIVLLRELQNGQKEAVRILYRPDNNGDDKLQPLPTFKLPDFTVEREAREIPTVWQETVQQAINNYHQASNRLEKDGYFTGHLIVHLVAEFVDHTQHVFSHPIYVPLSYHHNTKPVMHHRYHPDGQDEFRWIIGRSPFLGGTSLYSSKPTMTMLITSEIKALYKKYEGIIKSVSVYGKRVRETYNWSTQMSDYVKIENDFDLQEGIHTYLATERIKNKEVEGLIEYPTLFKIKEFPLDDFINAEEKVTEVHLDLEGLEEKMSVRLDSQGAHSIHGEVNTIINGRIHTGRTITELGRGTKPSMKGNKTTTPGQQAWENLYPLPPSITPLSTSHMGDHTAEHKLLYQFHIKTDQGEKIVHKVDDNPIIMLGANRTPIFSPGFAVMYPDIRCHKVRIFWQKKPLATLPMKPHPFQNMAWYHKLYEIPETFIGRTPSTTSTDVENLKDQFYLLLTHLAYDSGKIQEKIPPETERAIVTAENNMRVSEYQNALKMPVELSYDFDTERIMSINNMSEVVSEGQFGMFPTYVFCSTNIWALKQTSVETVYERQITTRNQPTTSEITLPIPGGIAFLSHGQLKILWRNQKVRHASQALNRADNIPAKEATTQQLMQYKDKVNLPENQIPNITSFREFSKTIKTMVFNYQKNEIILSNISDNFSYVYNTEFDTWYKVSWKADGIVRPEKGSFFFGRQILSSLYTGEGGVAVLLGVGGVNYGLPHGYKKLHRAYLRANFPGLSSILFLVLSTNDLSLYQISGGSWSVNPASAGLYSLRAGQSAKSFVYIFAGFIEITPSSAVDSIDSEWSARYNNRIK